MSTFTPVAITSIFTRGQRNMLDAMFTHANSGELDRSIMSFVEQPAQDPLPLPMILLQKAIAKPEPTISPPPAFDHNAVMWAVCVAFGIDRTTFMESKRGAKGRAAYFRICDRFGHFDRHMDMVMTLWRCADHRKASHGLETARRCLRVCPKQEPPYSAQSLYHAWNFTRSYERALKSLGLEE